MGQEALPEGALRLPDLHVPNDSDHSSHISGFTLIPPLSRFEELLRWAEGCAAVVPPYRRSDFQGVK